MNIYVLSGAVLTGALLSIFLREYKREYSALIGLGVTGIILLAVAPLLTSIVQFVKDISTRSETVSAAVAPLLKAVGLAVVTEIVSGICTDAGESAMAKNIELAGKVGILVIAIPLVTQIVNMIGRLLK